MAPIILAALAGLGLVAFASGGRPRRARPVPADLEAWGAARRLVIYLAPAGWRPATDCVQRFSDGTPIDVVVTTEGAFWRPNHEPGSCPKKCVSGTDLARDFRAWLAAR